MDPETGRGIWLLRSQREGKRGGKRGKGEGEVIEMAETHGLSNATRTMTFTSSAKVEFLNVTTVDIGGWVILCHGGREVQPLHLPSRCY